MCRFSILAVLAGLGACATAAQAQSPLDGPAPRLTPPGALTLWQKTASARWIVIASVKCAYIDRKEVEGGRFARRFALEIVVEKVEKGKGLESGSLIYARGWQEFDASGVYERGHLIPASRGKDRHPHALPTGLVRLYLARGCDGGFDIVFPNGGVELPLADDDPAAAMMDKVQGDWKVAALELDGKPAPARLGANFAAIRADQCDIAGVLHALLQFDPDAKTGAIDLTPHGGMHAGKIMRGIYVYDGKTLRICACPPDADRPTEAASGPGRLLLVLER